MPSSRDSYSSIFINCLYNCVSLARLYRSTKSLDLSQRVILQGTHYIGIGEHADLWIGIMSGQKVAVKLLRGGSSSNPDFLLKFKERLEHEAHIWHHLQHRNVSEFYGIAFNFGYMPALILPFYGNGTVVDYANKKDDETKKDLVRQISEGLEYLHEQSVVHGDLRGSNVLMDGDEQPRICDYGLAFIIEPSEFTSIKTAGACRWTAPEIMNPPENTTSTNETLALFTKESDIYAFAMTALEIFTGKIPFSQKKNDSSVIFAVLDGGRPELPPSLTKQESLAGLVQECWDQDPGRRPTSRAAHERLSTDSPEANSPVDNPSKGWFGSWL